MQFEQVLKNRYSCRSYTGEQVGADRLTKIAETALAASPSAMNIQPYRLIGVTDPEQAAKMRVALAAGRGANAFTSGATAFLAVAEIAVDKWISRFKDIDAGILIQNICLAAAAEGLGTCILGRLDEAEVKSICGIPDDMEVKIVVAVGVPQGEPVYRARKGAEQLLSLEVYSGE